MLSIKKRNPLVIYLLGWITCFIYYFVWMFQIMEELNMIKGSEVFNRRKKLNTLIAIFLPLSFLFLAITLIRPNGESIFIFSAVFITAWILAMSWLVFISRTLMQISSQIAAIEVAQSSPSKISPVVSAILFFAFYASMPYIQIHMNGIIQNSTSNLGLTSSD